MRMKIRQKAAGDMGENSEKPATSWFGHLKNFSLNFSSSLTILVPF